MAVVNAKQIDISDPEAVAVTNNEAFANEAAAAAASLRRAS